MTHGRSEELRSKLTQVARLLEQIGEERWAAWLRADLASIQRGDAHGLDHLLSAYGGMGSLNDLIVTPANGHPVSEEKAAKLDAELHALLSDIYTAARSLR
jgi:hypothetical protein